MTGRSPSGRATRASTEPCGLGHSASVPSADSGNIPGYFGILNPWGQFWSHTVHKSEAEAREYIRRFWRNTGQAEDFLRHCKIIPVRVRIEPLGASGIETEGQDAERLGAEHESPISEAETPNTSSNTHSSSPPKEQR